MAHASGPRCVVGSAGLARAGASSAERGEQGAELAPHREHCLGQ
eukprot:CAMPEP_0195107498 /NCGR_PEP_ID=MMETSP0448-20130528/82118_1 /TAXON_ID=66468 /ORGANISM="Heterocapsa triquestra, Strain CCMP 448" /LENGTH=43 /DNA_ID= /DNA_START= /DNA_END= /DNA_ORIENTATION=